MLKARNNPRGVGFDGLLTLVVAPGFERIRQHGGSHRRFYHPEAGVYLNLQPLRGGKAKDYQVAQLLDAVDAFRLAHHLDEDGRP